MFELILHSLKRVPRPLLPFVPVIATLLGPTAALLLIVYSVPSVHQEETSGWQWQSRSDQGRIGLVSPSAPQARTTTQRFELDDQ
jgi:hypothetical protein